MDEGTIQEELRFAVVLNGGVSLAIWMGGATHELDRLTRGDGMYGQLLAWAMSTARVDVISGTSAGGINGAALALAQCNSSPARPSLGLLRDVWLDSGSIQQLLRQPFHGSPTSLLQGDEFFLPQINRAMRQLSQPYAAAAVAERPMDLTITTTLLRGVPGVVSDYLGQKVGQSRHDGLFRFRRGPTHPDSQGETDAVGDDFSDARVTGADGDLVAAIALAARTTASYPIAFEPSYLPTTEEHAPERTRATRPNVAPYLSGAWDQSQDGVKRARYAADGGVLANTPTQPAMAAVDAMPASGPVRRVLLLVHPHAPAVVDDTHDDPAEAPTFAGTATALVKAITSQGGRNFVDLVARHNAVAHGRRELRADIVERLDPTPDAPDQLRAQALCVYGLYRRMRLRRASRDLTDIWLTRRWQPSTAPTPPGQSSDYPDPRPSSEQPESTGSVQPDVLHLLSVYTQRAASSRAPGADTTDLGPAFLPQEINGLPAPDGMGIEGAVGIADAAADYLRRAMWWAVTDAPHRARQIESARAELSAVRHQLHVLQQDLHQLLAKLADDTEHDDLGRWTDAAFERHARLCSARLRGYLDAIGGAVLRTALTGEEVRDAQLRGFATALFAGEEVTTTETVLERLSHIQMITYVVSCENVTGNALPIDLVQLTFQVEHPFASSMTGEAKVAGDLLARFSGFLKRSWRLNDWTWGRLDASRVLCQTVLDPIRVRRYLLQGAGGQDIVELAEGLLDSVSDDEALRAQMGLPTVEELKDELDEVRNGRKEPLERLPAVFAAAIALEIAGDEVPQFPRAVCRDVDEGSDKRAPGTVFVKSARDLFENAADGTPAQRWVGLQQFAAAGIGRESLYQEASSDQMIQTSTNAAANAVTILDSDRSGLPALKPVTRTLRGATLLPYWVVRGLTGGNALARTAAQLSLSLGGVLVVLGLLGAAPPWAATGGVGLVLVAFAYGALRSGTILHGVVLLVPALILLALTLPGTTDSTDPTTNATTQTTATAPDGATTPSSADTVAEDRQDSTRWVVVAAIALVLGLFVLGSLTPPIVDPTTWWRQLSGIARGAWAAGTVLVLGAASLPLFADVWTNLAKWVHDQRWPGLTGLPWWVGTSAVAVTVLGGITLAWDTGRMLRVLALRPVAADSENRAWTAEPSHAPDAVTAGWSVVYGLIAGVLTYVAARTAGVAVTAALAVSTLLLLLVVPLRLHRRTATRLRRRANDAYTAAGLDDDTTEETRIAVLFGSGLNHRYLVKPMRDAAPGPPPGLDRLELVDGG